MNLPILNHRNQLIVLWMLALSLSQYVTFAQNETSLKGNVINIYRQPVSNACIKNPATGKFVFSDEDGIFSIQAKEKDSLEIDADGYYSRMICIEKDMPGDIILAARSADIIAPALREEAAFAFLYRQLPATKKEWESHKRVLKSKLLTLAGIVENHKLPLDVHETGRIQRTGFSIQKIYFQTRPGVYATANLYVPDGNGPFPAVINSHGHWENSKAATNAQAVAQELALNGYVSLNIDAWGAGERTTTHGVAEYHGASLGGYLLNLGESLLGNQVSDNMRGIDLLCSLPFVDSSRIGATGASGGGNQTMWLAAFDERVKACMPVVSAGTFESCVMGSNCICELMPQGLQFTEEAGVISMIAPRAIKMCNALQEENKTFLPAEMLRTYSAAKPVFGFYGKEENIAYGLFNTTHDYFPVMRQALIQWFDIHLKGINEAPEKTGKPVEPLPAEDLMVFSPGNRSPLVKGTYQYCREKSEALSKSPGYTGAGKEQQRKALKKIFLMEDQVRLQTQLPSTARRQDEESILLRSEKGDCLPVTIFPGSNGNRQLVIFCRNRPDHVSADSIFNDYRKKGYQVIVPDLKGFGLLSSAEASTIDGKHAPFHTLSRSELWLGHSLMGEWLKEMELIVQYCSRNYPSAVITIDAEKEMALTALTYASIGGKASACILRTCPLSFVVDRDENIDFFNMSILLPGVLTWGDVSKMAALSDNSTLTFVNPVSITGQRLDDSHKKNVEQEIYAMKKRWGSSKAVHFR